MRKRLPTTPDEWQAAVDAATGALALDSARQYGLVTGGPKVNVARCVEILDAGERRRIVPRKDAIERFIACMPVRKLPPNDVVIAMYRSGMSTGEIAEKTGTKPGAVHSSLVRCGEPLRSTAEALRIRSEKGRDNNPRYWLGKKQPAAMVEKRISQIRGARHYAFKDGKSIRRNRGAKKETDG